MIECWCYTEVNTSAQTASIKYERLIKKSGKGKFLKKINSYVELTKVHRRLESVMSHLWENLKKSLHYVRTIKAIKTFESKQL